MNLMGFAGLADPRGSLYYKSQQLVDRLSGRTRPPMPGQFFIEYDPDPVSAWKKYVAALAQQRGTPQSNPQIEHEEPIKGVSGGWTGKLVSGTMTIKGETFAFTGSLMTSPPPPPVGNWSLGITILARGRAIQNAVKDFPSLIADEEVCPPGPEDVGREHQSGHGPDERTESSRWIAANKAAGDAARDSRFASSDGQCPRLTGRHGSLYRRLHSLHQRHERAAAQSHAARAARSTPTWQKRSNRLTRKI